MAKTSWREFWWRIMLRGGLLSLFLSLAVASVLAQSSDQSTSQASSATKPIHPPVPINAVEARFPAAARRDDGVCTVSMVVDTDGIPKDAKIVKCSDPIFAENSLAAVEQYRFKPAVDQNGKPVKVRITVEVNFRAMHYGEHPTEEVKYVLRTPPGLTSPTPDTNGIYPLTSSVDPPVISKIVNSDFRKVALSAPKGSSCEIVVTIDPKGKPHDAQVIHCNPEYLEKSAVDSVLKTHFRPGRVNGQTVAVRASVYIEYEGVEPKP